MLRPFFVAALLLSYRAVAADPLSSEPSLDEAAPAAIIELTMTSDGSRMPGLAYLASGAGPHPTFVLLHGFPGNEKNLDLAQVLRRAGFNVVFFHYRGAWGAEGDYRVTQLPDDVAAVLAYLREPDNAESLRIDTDKLSLLGHSLGGWTALATGSRDSDLQCIGAMAPGNIGQWKAGVAANDPSATRFLDYADTLFMLSNFDSAVLKQELASAPMESLDIETFGPQLAGKSVLMVTGDTDPVTPGETIIVPAEKAYSAVDNLKVRSMIISGDHSFSWSRLALSRIVLEWADADCR